MNLRKVSMATIVSILVLCLFFSISCGVKKIDYEDNGKTVSVEKGKSFSIILESNPTTGYDWYISGDSQMGNIDLIDSDYEQSSKNKKLVGAGGSKIFTFEAMQSGSALISLEYKRDFEEGVEPIDRFSININID